MTAKNKKLEITSGIVGGLYAAIHVIVAIILITGAATSGGINTEGLGILVFFLIPLLVFAVGLVIVSAVLAIWSVASVVLPMRAQNVGTIRKVAIVTSILLAIKMFIEVNFIFGIVVRGFREGNYLRAILTILFIILSVVWFVLNIIRAKIYKVKKGEEQ